MPATVQLEISDDQMRNLLVSAFEGGSNYWMFIKGLEYPKGKTKKDYEKSVKDGDHYWQIPYVLPFVKGGGVVLQDVESDDTWTLTKEKMEEGVRVMAVKYPHHFKDLMTENCDADTGDVFLQCSLFGELVYG